MALLIARSLLARFTRDMPQAPPRIANGNRTTVALTTAAPTHGPPLQPLHRRRSRPKPHGCTRTGGSHATVRVELSGDEQLLACGISLIDPSLAYRRRRELWGELARPRVASDIDKDGSS